jgi:hypothetical protein
MYCYIVLCNMLCDNMLFDDSCWRQVQDGRYCSSFYMWNDATCSCRGVGVSCVIWTVILCYYFATSCLVSGSGFLTGKKGIMYDASSSGVLSFLAAAVCGVCKLHDSFAAAHQQCRRNPTLQQLAAGWLGCCCWSQQLSGITGIAAQSDK